MAGQAQPAAPGHGAGRMITGLLIGIAFGILLYAGNLVRYDVIEGQLLLVDFTFLEVLLSAILVATAGFFLLSRAGLADRKIMQPSLGTHLAGGLIMGTGFALLGYGPASILAATGAGYPDTLAGLLGILCGAGLFARSIYPRISRRFLGYRNLEFSTLPDLLGAGERTTVILVCVLLLMITGILYFAHS